MSDKIEEERKIINIEKDKQHKLGIEQGKEIGIKEGIELGIKQGQEIAIRELKRKEKADNYKKRYIKCNLFIMKRKIKKLYKIIVNSKSIKFIFGLIGVIGSCIAIYSWIKGF